jgi:prepilin-type N-terminal cleavage/methylation domain-containing protein
MKLSRWRGDASGLSMVEVLVALVIFSVVIVGLTSAGIVAGAQLRMSRTDVRVWTAAHYQLEKVTAAGYDGVSAGTDTVQGYPVSWDVQGTDPKKVILTVQAKNSAGVVVPDTFVTYLADWTP